ncbi:MAG: hypothetical protein JXB49_15465 [Bacteroidales bacterium]|nr:hypothetical protein [Bacteroidales bacterium]MBN2817976.1 hypothetical protein [Bacteroidales bacterium]
MKKLKKISVWIVVLVYLIGISGFVTQKHEGILCNKIEVIIADSLAKRFLNRDDINKLILSNNLAVLGEPIASINTDSIERLVLANTMVKNCEAYTTVDGKLNIKVNQREPVVRIIDMYNQNYYLDAEGSIITMSSRFTPHVLVVNGNIKTPFSIRKVENIYAKQYDKKATHLREIHEMSMFIKQNQFWNSQIEQMYLNKKGEYEIIPRVGPHLIILGNAEGFKEKLDKLWIFYNEGLKNTGWNKYLKINLKYKDQIVCSKI